MRTTLELPDDLLKRAKIEAVERGTTLRELVGAALERELSEPASVRSNAARKRVRFPIFDSTAPGALRLTGEPIAKLEADEDARRHGRGHRWGVAARRNPRATQAEIPATAPLPAAIRNGSV